MKIRPDANQTEKNAHYRVVLTEYANAISRGNLEAICALFADDAEIEDPIGGLRFSGSHEVRKFYTAVVASKAFLNITGPVVGSKSNAAAIPMRGGNGGREVNVISLAFFTEDGLIKKYQALWGPGDFEGGDPTENLVP
jgi:steroid Delta-isomerase